MAEKNQGLHRSDRVLTGPEPGAAVGVASPESLGQVPDIRALLETRRKLEETKNALSSGSEAAKRGGGGMGPTERIHLLIRWEFIPVEYPPDESIRWKWRAITHSGEVVQQSEHIFETRIACEADAQAHGFTRQPLK
jgi:hypothetical protein